MATIKEAVEVLENAALALQSWGGERGEQLLEEFQKALTAYGRAVLDAADDGNAAAVCSEFCVHRIDKPEGCPVNQLAALRAEIEGR